MKIYNISKGQLIILWFFGVIGWFGVWAIGQGSDSLLVVFLFVFIPFVLIFYTLGWINRQKAK